MNVRTKPAKRGKISVFADDIRIGFIEQNGSTYALRTSHGEVITAPQTRAIRYFPNAIKALVEHFTGYKVRKSAV